MLHFLKYFFTVLPQCWGHLPQHIPASLSWPGEECTVPRIVQPDRQQQLLHCCWNPMKRNKHSVSSIFTLSLPVHPEKAFGILKYPPNFFLPTISGGASVLKLPWRISNGSVELYCSDSSVSWAAVGEGVLLSDDGGFVVGSKRSCHPMKQKELL